MPFSVRRSRSRARANSGRAAHSIVSRAACHVLEQLEPRKLLSSPFTITEFMADNTKTLADEDGQYGDWVEIHNSAGTAQSLSGFHLTDSPSDLAKWTFPAVSVPANGNIVVFADGKDRTNPAANLHTNFSLEASGEYLALTEPDGVTKDSEYNFGQQQTDISYGIDPNGGAQRFFAAPTPGAANQRAEVVINEIHYQPDVKTQLVEFIELYNPGSAPVDLSGASFTSGVSYTFPANSILQPGNYMVIAENQAQFQAKFQSTAYGQFTGTLANSGEQITLRNASGGKLDEVDYGAGFPWPTVGDSPGYSIQLINPDFDNSVGGNWRSGAPSVLASAAPSTQLFPDHSNWDYRKGTSEASTPTSLWKGISFSEDASWFQNKPAPVGYDPSVVMGSKLTDMLGGYVSVFMRKTFTITDPAQFSALKLSALYDDGFNVWINGVHVLRSPEMLSDDPAFNASVADDNPNAAARENNTYTTFTLNNPAAYLVAGTNIISVHFHNIGLSNSTDAFFDASLTAVPAANVAAGALNVDFSANSPPAIRQVSNSPQAPVSNTPVTITAKVTDPDGVGSVNLLYQIVDPGAYIAITDAAYATAWTSVPMYDDGTNGDAVAGDSIFTAVMPASLQVNRRLIRYRFNTTDGLGASVTVPYADDPQPNFAYFTYDGNPAYTAAVNPAGAGSIATPTTFSAAVMNSIPSLYLISKQTDVENSTWYQQNTGNSSFNWHGTIVFNGQVYDHIGYRPRGGVWRYAMGKNAWKFDFQNNHEFQGQDDYGIPWAATHNKLNLRPLIQQKDFWNRGEQGLYESVSLKMFQLAGVPASDTTFMQLRVIDKANPSGTSQYTTDFWGLYLAVENYDGDFQNQHDLPDGNQYDMESGTGPGGGRLDNQGPTQPSDNSDLLDYTNTYKNTTPDDTWWQDNLDLSEYYSYRSILESVHHYDVDQSAGKNYIYYHNPDTGKWEVFPWDLDLTWADNMYGGGDEPYKSRVLPATLHPAFNIDYQNRLREIRDLLYNPDQTGALIDEMAAKIYTPGQPSLVDADRDQWDYNPIMVSQWVNSSKAGQGFYYAGGPGTVIPAPGGFAGMMNKMKNYIVSRGNWVDTNLLTDNSIIPNTPAISYLGAGSHPLDDLRFRSSAFSKPASSSASFAAMQWRIAEITDPNAPGYDPKAPKHYEIDPTWQSPEMTTFASDIQIPSNVVIAGHVYRVRVRMKDSTGRWSHWSDPVQFTASAVQSATKDSIRVTELDYNPAGAPSGSLYKKDDFEFIELKNIGPAAVNLQGAQFTTGITFTFPDLLLEPGESSVIVDNLDAFQSRYPTAGLKIAGVYSGNLSNSGEEIILKDPIGQVIQDFTYGTNAPWPTTPDGGGESLVIKDPLGPLSAWSDPAAWNASRSDNGTPGADESTVPDSAVVVNEILSNSGTGADWIELHNTTNADVDISSWWLSDTSVTPQKYQIPSNTILPANGYYTLDQFTSFGSPAAVLPFAFNAVGDDAVISSANAAGIPTGYIQAVHFDGSDEGVTLGRYVKATGGSDFVPLLSPTKNSPNSAATIGPVVINELMYSPTLTLSPSDEYIEIYNITSNPVLLYDSTNPANTWKISNGVDFTFPGGASLASHAYALVVPIDPATFRSRYSIPANVQIFGPYTGALNNAGETVTLSRPATPQLDNTVPYVPIDSIKYSNTAPWPINADGTGSSIGRLSPTAYGNEPSNWTTEVVGGTPGLPTRDVSAPTVSLPVIDPLPKPTPLDSLPISFSEPVQGFDLSHLTLTRNGGPNLLGPSQVLTTTDNANFTLANLTPLDLVQGNYTLTVLPNAITDLTNQPLAAGASTSWSMTASALVGGAGDDSWIVSISSPSLNIWHNTASTNPPTYTVAASALSSLILDGGDGVNSVSFIGGPASVGAYSPAGAAGVSPSFTLDGLPIQLTNVDAVSVGAAQSAAAFGSLTVVTPNSSDALLIDSPGPGQARISGISSGASLLPITLFNTSTVIVDMASHDSPGNADTLSVGAIPSSSFSHLQVRAGDGSNAVAINGATLTLDTNSGGRDGSNLAVIINANSNVTFPSSQKLSSLTVNSGAHVTTASAAHPALNLSSLKISGNGVLDLVSSDLIITYTDTSPESTIQQYLQNSNLQASQADDASFSQFLRTLAVWDNAETRFSTFGATSLPDFSQVLVKYTYHGDANLDGSVSPRDYAIVDGNIGPDRDWGMGDLNGDGSVTPADYAQIDGNIGAGNGAGGGPQLAVLPESQASTTVARILTKSTSKTKRHPKARAQGHRRPAKKHPHV